MRKLAERNQNFMQRYHAVLMPLLLALLSYAGVDGYGRVQEMRAETAAVTVTVESPEAAGPHSHPQSKHRTNAEIQAVIDGEMTHHKCQYHGAC